VSFSGGKFTAAVVFDAATRSRAALVWTPAATGDEVRGPMKEVVKNTSAAATTATSVAARAHFLEEEDCRGRPARAYFIEILPLFIVTPAGGQNCAGASVVAFSARSVRAQEHRY
jgi:hypothetical protein